MICINAEDALVRNRDAETIMHPLAIGIAIARPRQTPLDLKGRIDRPLICESLEDYAPEGLLLSTQCISIVSRIAVGDVQLQYFRHLI